MASCRLSKQCKHQEGRRSGSAAAKRTRHFKCHHCRPVLLRLRAAGLHYRRSQTPGCRCCWLLPHCCCQPALAALAQPLPLLLLLLAALPLQGPLAAAAAAAAADAPAATAAPPRARRPAQTAAPGSGAACAAARARGPAPAGGPWPPERSPGDRGCWGKGSKSRRQPDGRAGSQPCSARQGRVRQGA